MTDLEKVFKQALNCLWGEGGYTAVNVAKLQNLSRIFCHSELVLLQVKETFELTIGKRMVDSFIQSLNKAEA